jgi:hypothetical protein
MPIALANPPPPPAQVAQPSPTAPHWLPGTWKGSKDGAAIEEIWIRGQSGLLGVFRMEKGSTAIFLEAMVIEPEGAETLLRIRHFGPGLKSAWEDRERPVTFRLAVSDDREARFEGTGPWAGQTLRYLRTGPSSLEVILEKPVDGKPRRSVFQFTREP